jgi:hypothetical protein
VCNHEVERGVGAQIQIARIAHLLAGELRDEAQRAASRLIHLF